MNEIKLLPCPFCGGETGINVVKTNQGQTASIVCEGCSCRKTMIRPQNYEGDIEKEICEAWNTRKPIERIVERLDERIEHHTALVNYEMNMGTIMDVERHKGSIKALDKAIEIVKEVGA